MFSLGLSEKAAADHHQIATHPQRDSSTWPWGHSKAALIKQSDGQCERNDGGTNGTEQSRSRTT